MESSQNFITRNTVIVGGIIILLLILAFSFQGQRGIWQPDEGYYVGTSLTMMEKQDFLIPYLGEEEIFLDKPPLLYWGIIVSMKMLGHNEFAARFFHGVCYVLTCLMVGALGFELFGNRRAAILSSLVYATMVVPFIAANIVTPDTPLVLWTTICAFAFWKSVTAQKPYASLWKLCLFAAFGFGFLAKGPAVLIPCAGMLPFLIIRKQLKSFLLDFGILAGIAVFCAIGLGWYIYIGCTLKGSFAYFFDSQIWGRLVSKKYHRNPGIAGIALYLFILTMGTLPWSAIWLQKSARITLPLLLQKQWWLNLRNRPHALFLILWGITSMLILCLASSKLPLYVLPLFAPIAIASAQMWSRRIDLSETAVGKKRAFSNSARFILIWCCLLITLKYVIAHYPTSQDTRALWNEICKYVPNGPYEINTVDARADGLIFYDTYGAKSVEHVTRKTHPYPTFSAIKQVVTVVAENKKESKKETLIFLVNDDKDAREVCSLLSKAEVKFNKIKLSWQRWLLIVPPEEYTKLSQ